MSFDRNDRLPDFESVWDYPRPPRIEAVSWTLRVEHEGRVLAETRNGVRVLETSHPPSYYFPREDVDTDRLVRSAATSLCGWKGQARYWDLHSESGSLIARVGWSYPDAAVALLSGRFSFYAGRVDACFVAGERVQPQPGDFYGGWITAWLKGPFKGGPGTLGW